MSMSRKYSLKEQVGYLFSGKVLALGMQLLIPVVLVRLIDKTDYGIYLQFLFIGQFLSTVLTFALPTSLYFFYPTAKEKLSQLISQTYFLLVLIVGVSIPFYLIFGNHLIAFFETKAFNTLFYPLGLYVFFRTLSLLLEHLFIVEQKSNYVIRYHVVFTLLRVSFLIASFVVFKTIFAMFWALVVLQILMALFLLIYLLNNYKLNINLKSWSKSYFGSQIKYVYPLAMGDIVQKIGKRADKFILTMFFTASDFAIYSVANLKIPIVNILFPSVSNVIVPQISKYRQEENYMEVKRLWHKMITGLTIITAPFIVFFAIIAKPLITFLYTDQYVDAVDIYRIILLTIFTLTLRGTTILMAFGRTQFIFITQMITMVLNIGIGYMLIMNFGLLGAAVSIVVVATIREFILIYKSKRILKLSYAEWLPWRKLGQVLLISLIPVPFVYPILGLSMSKFFILAIASMVYLIIILFIYNKIKIIDLNKISNQIKKSFIERNG